MYYIYCINGKKGDICKLVHKSHMKWQKRAKVTWNGKKGLKSHGMVKRGQSDKFNPFSMNFRYNSVDRIFLKSDQ